MKFVYELSNLVKEKEDNFRQKMIDKIKEACLEQAKLGETYHIERYSAINVTRKDIDYIIDYFLKEGLEVTYHFDTSMNKIWHSIYLSWGECEKRFIL